MTTGQIERQIKAYRKRKKEVEAIEKKLEGDLGYESVNSKIKKTAEELIEGIRINSIAIFNVHETANEIVACKEKKSFDPYDAYSNGDSTLSECYWNLGYEAGRCEDKINKLEEELREKRAAEEERLKDIFS